MLSNMFIRRTAGAMVACVGLLAPALANAKAIPLTLINGWTNYSTSTNNPTITAIKGVAYLKGAIATAGTNVFPFVLPAAYRPAANVYVKVDLCDAHNGRLDISPDGTVQVGAENGDFSAAQCFTSLEGVSYALSSDGYKSVKLKKGWTVAPFGTATPAAKSSGGTVYLEGGMASSKTGTDAFTLPKKLRPSATVYAPADMYQSSNGRLVIYTNGLVQVQAESDITNAFEFTSLEGISYAVNSSGFTSLSLTNGWVPYGTRNPLVRLNGNVVQFQGSIANGSAGSAFTLPVGMRPSKIVYVPVDTYGGTNGRLEIHTDGTVYVESENSATDSQGFTSLESVSFLL
jgi:hypothetical protein